ncbi:MAG: energy-coupling factor transporter transmembrane component T [Candidatus Hodarchaeales archaeon]
MNLDPRVSIIALVSGFVAILISSNLLFQILIVIILIVLSILDKGFIKSFKIIFLLVIPSLILVILDFFTLSSDLSHLLLMIGRFWGLSWLFNWFLSNVDPTSLAKALRSFHVPYHYAWQISLAYRFLPLFQRESERIYQAQISRGIPLDGNFIQKVRYLPSLSIPLLVMTQDKAELFAEALFSRNWNPTTPKTVLNPLSMKTYDWVILFLVVIFFFIGLAF